MTFSELLDNWIGEKIIRAQTDLIARISKLEMKVSELKRLVVQRENEPVSEYLIDQLIQTRLCNTDWNDMIGEEVNELIESAIDNNDSVRTEIRNLVDEQLDGELDDLEVTIRRG